jgi:lipoprotein NlpI
MYRLIPVAVLFLVAIPARADSPGELVDQANAALKKGDPAAAVKFADQAIAADPKLGIAYDVRGTAHFKLGKIKESLADFDRYIELVPAEGPKHWRRGLTLYYADEFAKGVAQFTSSDKEAPEDVENAIWHFLCDAKVKGVEKARGEILKVKMDERGPLFMKIYDLFRGTAKPEDVLAEADAGKATDDQRTAKRFYANYYVGMYYECVGEPKKSLEYLKTAVEKYPIGDYMMDVAKVHIQLRSTKP